MRWAAALGVGFLIGALSSPPSCEAAAGRVFEDLNGDGRAGVYEPGIPGVVVSRGSTLAVTDANGRYVLPDAVGLPAEGTEFVVLTRPAGFDCARWYRPRVGDFALRRRARDGSSFVFAHVTDAHLSDSLGDYARYGVPETIAQAPTWLSGLMYQVMLRFQDPDYSKQRVVDAVREPLSERVDTTGMSDTRVLGEWVSMVASLDETDEGFVVDPVGGFDAALAELRAIDPRFVVNTGDFVLESNEASAEEVERWMRFYRERVEASGLVFYDTIGNNEIAGTNNEDFGPEDPGYGKGLYRRFFGPTYYAFDRGDLHFIALDTHAADPKDPERWSFSALEPVVRRWFAADTAMHAGQPIVVLNHEPIASDRRWSLPLQWGAGIDREGVELIEGAGARWTLAGHVHLNGVRRSGPTQHIVTGALSGARWTLPPDAVARGYRLVQRHGGELYSVWKPLGAPQVAFIEPRGHGAAHVTGPRLVRGDSPDQPRRVVVAGVDVAGPLSTLRVALDGESLPLDWWSPYFAETSYVPATLSPGTHVLSVEAVQSNGETVRREMSIEVPER